MFRKFINPRFINVSKRYMCDKKFVTTEDLDKIQKQLNEVKRNQENDIDCMKSLCGMAFCGLIVFCESRYIQKHCKR